MQKVSIFVKLLATGGGLGLSPFAPGTAGTIGALLISLVVLLFINDPFIQIFHLILVLATYVIGVIVTKKVIPIWGNDPSRVVIDEFCGFWLAIAFIPASVNYYILAFILFRFFDITKILGISYFDRKKTAHGVMLDDVIAGLYTSIVLLIVFYLELVPV